MKKNWQNALLGPETPIFDALRVVDDASLKLALVVDKENKLLGVVTDGDVRRGILEGVPLHDPVSMIMNGSPQTASVNDDTDFLKTFMRNQGIDHLPVLDIEGHVVGLELLSELLTSEPLPGCVVLMAGGLGSRLHPLTSDCPKPLLPIGEKPLLETIIREMCTQGFQRFYITINYLGEKVRDYFGDGSSLGVEICYIEEESRLGTAGALSLLPTEEEHPIVIVNGDVLTKLNFRHLLQFHHESRARATMCVSHYDFTVPYGVARVRDRQLVAIDEKPELKYLVNAGIYAVDADVVSELKKGERQDMTDVFNRLIADRDTAVVFPIREYWIDIGRASDLELARTDFEKFFGENQ